MSFYAALIISVLALLWCRDSAKTKIQAVLLSLVFLLTWLSLGFYYIANSLSGVGVDESVVFHLFVDLSGADYLAFLPQLIGGGLAVAIIGIASWYIYRSSYKGLTAKRGRYAVAVVLLAASHVINPLTRDLSEIYAEGLFDNNNEEVSIGYVSMGDVEINKKNIVYVYLESLERTYLNEEIFPGLMPNLKRLERAAVSFSGVEQARATGWTIAGMVASQCGVPLIMNAEGNSMRGRREFLRDAVCLGDILNQHNYKLNYVGGARLDFAGKGDFYRTHGFSRVEGLDELHHHSESREYVTGWGLYDDTVFGLARKRYEELIRAGDPFGLFMLTMDTHHPNGYMSKSCKGLKYGSGGNPILNAVHCADRMVGEFVDYLRMHPNYSDTLIVLASDHLAMPNSASGLLRLGERKNLFLLFDENLTPTVNLRKGSTLDIAPTILSRLVETPVKGMGFGRNLLSEEELSIQNETGFNVNRLIGMNRGFLKSLWAYPDIRKGVRVESLGQISIDNEKIALPVLLSVNKTGGIDSMYFEVDSGKSLSEYLAEFDEENGFVWIDRCEKISHFARSSDLPLDLHGDCLLSGIMGAVIGDSIPLTDSTVVDYGRLDLDQRGAEFNQERYLGQVMAALKIDKFSAAEEFREIDVNEYIGDGWHGLFFELSDKLNRLRKWFEYLAERNEQRESRYSEVWPDAFVVRSTGGLGGASYVESVDGRYRVDAVRGVTLFGFNKGAPPVKIAHIDTCQGKGGGVKDSIDTGGSFESLMSATRSVFSVHALVAHDSAVCGENIVESVLYGMKLSKSPAISMRTPYVAIFIADQVVYEHVGSPESSSVVMIKNVGRKFESGIQRKLENLPRVAHAGGGYGGKTYTNSIDALNYNKSHYELFEIDFSWTSDQELVCLHDWDHSYKRSFDLEPAGARTLDDFIDLVKTHSDVEKCHLASLIDWLKKHPHARIVTDIKERNYEALKLIKNKYPEMQQRFVPQVYQPVEYYLVKNLGFKDIVWTLYRYVGNDSHVASHLRYMDLLGLTMPRGRADRGLALTAQERSGVLSWVHTVDDNVEMARYEQLGVASFYTDWSPGLVGR